MSELKRIALLFASFCFLIVAGTAHGWAQETKIVGFGDSLMAGYQLPPGASLAERLEDRLRENGHDVAITNAGVSGDTTSGGLERLDWSVPDGTDLVILELGANDALRGLPPDTTEANLEAMITRLKERGIAVVLAGMLAPPNLGKDYEDRFNAIYPQLAEKYDLPLYPFILDGVAATPELQLADGMHPNEKGIERMVDGLYPVVEKALETLPK